MKTITAKVSSQGSTSCHFILQDIDGNKQIKRNMNHADFSVEAGKKYAMVILVHGDPSTKYKLTISGATKASYPTRELSIEGDGRDELGARITG